MKNDLKDQFFTKRLITSTNTKRSYSSSIDKFFSLIGKDIDTYFKNTPESIENDLNKAYLLLEKSNVPLLTRKTQLNAVKQFLCTHNKKLKELDFWEILKNRLKGASPISDEDVPNAQDIKTVLSHGNTKGRAIFLMMASCGCRIGELLALYPSDIDTTATPTKIRITKTYDSHSKIKIKNTTKTNSDRVCFISKEATEAYLEWMKEREQYLKTAVKKTRNHYAKDKDDKRVFPMSDENARVIWATMIQKSGMYKTDDTTNRLTLHPHCLRKFFRSYLGNADLAEHLMGHKTGMDKFYRNKKKEDLADDYLKVMENVTIFETPADVSGLHDRIDQKEKEFKELDQKYNSIKIDHIQMQIDLGKALEKIKELEKKG